MSFLAGLLPSGAISLERQKNLLGGAAPFYRCYRCADGRDISVGAIEKPFYRELLERIGAPASLLESQNDPARWAADSAVRSEEHTSELQSLMRISYAVFCLKKKKN